MKISDDADSKKAWNVEIDGKIAGGVYATSIGGQVTGFRAGHMESGFQGALLCFPYDAEVMTETGPVKIGDVVTLKNPTKVFSFNQTTGRVELRCVRKYFENPGAPIVRISFSDDSSVECTENHKIFTENRGWVEARYLISSDVVPRFESGESLVTGFIRKPYFFIEAFRRFSRKVMRVPEALRVSVPVVVASSCSVFKVFDRIIPFISVKVTDFNPWQLRADKCVGDGLVDLDRSDVPVSSCPENTVTNSAVCFFVRNTNRFGRYFSNRISVFYGYYSSKASNHSRARYFVKPLKSQNRFPLDVSFVRHDPVTFCISVDGNRNFFINQGQQALLVSNCDDLIKPEDAFSKSKIDHANRRLITTVQSRLAQPETPIILVMQRLGENDPAGFIRKGNLGDGWHFVTIPALMDESYVASLPKKYFDLINPGEIIDGRFSYWPYKEPIKKLLQMERGDGTDASGQRVSRHVFSSQYQQAPKAMGGNIIKGKDFVRYQFPPQIKHRKIFVDTAQKTATRNDYSVFEEWGVGTDGRIYLLNLIRGKWEAPELQRRAVAFWSMSKSRDVMKFGQCRTMKVEDKVSGTGLIQTLKLPPYNIPVEAVQRSKDKVERVNDGLPYIESGQVCVPEQAPFTNDFIAECESFTADGSHDFDDQVDPMLDAIDDMAASGNKLKVWEQLGNRPT